MFNRLSIFIYNELILKKIFDFLVVFLAPHTKKILNYRKNKLYPQIKIGLSSYHIYIQLLELLSTFMHNRVLITYTCYYI